MPAGGACRGVVAEALLAGWAGFHSSEALRAQAMKIKRWLWRWGFIGMQLPGIDPAKAARGCRLGETGQDFLC